MLKFLLDILFLKSEVVLHNGLSAKDIETLSNRSYDISYADDERFLEMLMSTYKKYEDFDFYNAGRFENVMNVKSSNDLVNIYFIGEYSITSIIFAFPNELCLMFDNYDNISIHHLSHIERHYGSKIRYESFYKSKSVLENFAPYIKNAISLGLIKPEDIKSEQLIKLWRLK